MKLFKVVSQRDETVIGIKDEELRAFGPPAISTTWQRLGTAGMIVVWQYAPKKGSDGQLQQAPHNASPCSPRASRASSPTRRRCRS